MAKKTPKQKSEDLMKSEKGKRLHEAMYGSRHIAEEPKKRPKVPLYAVRVDINSYLGSHGRHPRFGAPGGGGVSRHTPWLFRIGGTDYTFLGIYSTAVKKAKRKAQQLEEWSVKVLP